jgi:hypothetical protein
MGDQPSINDHGMVAFVGQLSGHEGIFVGDGSSASRNITPTFSGQTGRFFGHAVQINNLTNVVAYDRLNGTPPLTFLRVWNASGNIVDSSTQIARGSSLPGYDFDLIYEYPSINNFGQVVFSADPTNSANTTVLATPGASAFNMAFFSGNVVFKPLIADSGRFAVRGGNLSTSSIRIYSADTKTLTSIANTGLGYTQMGQSPGISDDETVIAFYGRNSDGPGIFTSVAVGQSWLTKKIAGTGNGFSDFVADTGVGVSSPRGNPKWAAIVYIGIKAGVTGVYKTILNFPEYSSGSFTADPPVEVVRAGDKIFNDLNGDGTWQTGTEPGLNGFAQSFNLYDPINADGDVAFWVQTTTGDQGIIKTSRADLKTPGYHQGDFAGTPFGPAAACSISAIGCALTTAANMASSFGPQITPISLDALLKSPDINGYSGCGMYYCKVPAALNGVINLELVRGGVRGETLDDYLIENFCNRGSRVVLKLREYTTTIPMLEHFKGNHYILITGRLNNDWKTLDPGWRNANPPENLLTVIGHATGFTTTDGNGIQTYRRFEVDETLSFKRLTVGPPADFCFDAHSPVELLVTDPLGRRIGFDSKAGTNVFDVAEACYLRDLPLANDEDDSAPSIGDPTGMKTLYVPSPASGSYQVAVTGTGTGAYTLNCEALVAGHAMINFSATGTTSTGQVSNFVASVPIFPPVVSLERVGTNVINLSFGSQNSLPYFAEFKDFLTQSSWSNLRSVIGNGGTATISDTNASGVARFYRIRASQ